MYKKSRARIENENESSQAELSNPALQDIIATNHVVFPKKAHADRLSRACKALIIMIILVLVSIGIIILTLVLAHSRNTLMAIVARSAEENFYATSNHSRLLFLNQQNSTTIANEPIRNENWPETITTTTTTVSLTSDNLPTLTTSNVHISSSSSVIRIGQHYDYISSTTQSQTMKSYPSLNTIVHAQSTISTTTETTTTTTISTTIQTTVFDQKSTFVINTEDDTTSNIMMMMTTSETPLISTMKSQDNIQTSSDNSLTTIDESTLSLVDDETTTTTPSSTMSEESSFTTFFRNHFNIQSSTVMMSNKQTTKNEQTNQKNFVRDEDVMDDILF